MLLAACGGSPSGAGSAAVAPSAMPAAQPTPPPSGYPSGAGGAMSAPAATAAPASAGAAQEAGVPAPAAQPTAGAVGAGDPTRKIIKDATLTLEVQSVDLALSRVNGIAAQMGGYVLETRTDYAQASQKQAVIRIAVPVDKFEPALQALREGANRVMSEQASGVDVTQEYVDVQSQLANLEATQARIRQFLDQAKTVDEALQVNARLTEVEGQISQLKGRLQFLSQRAAYSTIAVQLQHIPPPTATPPPPPTPEPLWNPAKTTRQATATLTAIAQAIATLAIWLAIVVLPLALPVALIALLVRLLRRRSGQAVGPHPEV
jgi:hypothetical protein